jgi:UDP-N-acetylglucosamine 2-epimerase (non-hydrolysing)
MSQKPIAIVLGTRPEIIKLSPILRLLEKEGRAFILIHTNQHYSAELDQRFFEELKLPAPTYNLQVGPGSQNEQTARMLERLDAILTKEQPSWMVVQGDTNSVLAGALAASKLNIPIAHVEAGLRSFDRTMPEETNRIITDHISSLLFAPTEESAELLRKEGIADDFIKVVGNTAVDAVLNNAAECTPEMLEPFNLQEKGYFLLTMHRPSNVDTKESLSTILDALSSVYETYKKPFFFPVHPRTQSALEKFNLTLPEGIIAAKPVGYLEMLALQKFAAAVFTDSGGIQEETCTLGTPCITLRENTERPETITVGANVLAGHNVEIMVQGLESFKEKTMWENPYGDGTTSEKILKELTT